MNEQWIKNNFETDSIENPTIFKSRENPESWTDIVVFVDNFVTCESTYESLSSVVSDSGFQSIFDEWKQRGLL